MTSNNTFAKDAIILVLSRKQGETICIGDDIEIVVSRIDGNRVTVGIVAPKSVKVLRGELIKEGAGDAKELRDIQVG